MTDTANRYNRVGLALLLAGLLALAATLGLTGWQLVGQKGSCGPVAATPNGARFVVTDNRIRLSAGMCIGISPDLRTTLIGTGTGVTLQFFFDRHLTPATLSLAKSDKVIADGPWANWTFVTVPLRPASSADSAVGKRWREIMTADGIAPQRAVTIGVAPKPANGDASAPVATTASSFDVFNPLLTALGGLGILLTAAGIVLRCWDTGLLRDRTPKPGGTDNPPFSLARAQMGVWLMLSVAGYLAIWLVTGLRSGLITGGLLTLLGISAGSGLAARMIDAADPAPTDAQSAGFWRDIVSEGYGDQRTVAVHRLQMLAWTLILGAIFVWTVLSSFSFPDFDTNLLLLMGISSGTYLGFKFPEKNLNTPKG